LLHWLLSELQELGHDLEGDEQEQLLDFKLFEEDGEEEQLDFAHDELWTLLHSEEQQLMLVLSELQEENGLTHDEEGEDKDELLEEQLLDGELEDILLDNVLEEQLILLELPDEQKTLLLCVLDELQWLIEDDDGLLHEEQLD